MPYLTMNMEPLELFNVVNQKKTCIYLMLQFPEKKKLQNFNIKFNGSII